MLSVRLQRAGRSGHAQYRVVIQDSKFSPTSGRVVAYVGSYDPHAKTSSLNGEAIKKYMDNGAQPTPRVITLLKANKITVPKWASAPSSQKRAVRNPDKRRSTAPAQPAAPAEEAQPAAEPEAEAPETEPTPPAAAEETPAESSAAETSEAPAEPAEPAAAKDVPIAEGEQPADAQAQP